MRHKKGFLLMECCVYLMLCAILTLTFIQWMTRTVYETGRTIQSTDKSMMNFLIQDVFMRDVQMAPNDRKSWVIILSDHVMWQTQEGVSVSWNIHNKQLVRKEGVYNRKIKQW